MDIEEISYLLETVRQKRPLIQNITNTVVTNFTANGLLALGASPAMADAEEEAADFARGADGLLLNLGTLTPRVINAMIGAGEVANRIGRPVVLDPVALGATPYRTEVFNQIIRQVKIDILRGNAAEMAQTIGTALEMKGVDAGGSSEAKKAEIAEEAARRYGTVAVVTGREDAVSNGKETYVVYGGHPLLARVTGSGCLLGSVLAAFAAVERDRVKASLAGLVIYGVAAELAAKESGENRPGSFQIAFLDRLSLLTKDEVLQYARIKRV